MDTNSSPFLEGNEAWYGGSDIVAFNNAQNLKYLESEEFKAKAQKMFEDSLKEDHVDYRAHPFSRHNLRTPEPRVITDNNPNG